MTYDETASVLALLAIEYRHEVIDQPRVALWAELLRDATFADAKAAALAWLTDAEHGRWFPRPADLLARVPGTPAALDAALYRRYAALRRDFQRGRLTPDGAAELPRIERRLGIGRSGGALALPSATS